MSRQRSLDAENSEDKIEQILFTHTDEEDIACYEKEELQKAAAFAAKALNLHETGKSTLCFERENITRKGEPITVITLVNDNKPFLLDSILNVFNQNGHQIYLIAHPVIDYASGQRISLMQIHIELLNKEQAQELGEKLTLVLEQVNAAVRDWKPMLEEINKHIHAYQTNLPLSYKKEGEKTIEFLKWLIDDNFIFLGMRTYDFIKGQEPIKSFKAGSIELGILTDASIRIIGDARVEEPPREILSFMESNNLLIVTKANSRSKIHRPVWLDYIGLKIFDGKGHLRGELRVVGLFTSSTYTHSILQIPFLKEKAEAIIQRLGYNRADYSGKTLMDVLETYPRDEMFRSDVDTLTKNAELIMQLDERPRLRVLAHTDPFGRFVSVFVYVPRDQYNSNIREKIGEYFMDIYEGDFFEYYLLFLESTLTRVHYVIHRKGGDSVPIIKRTILEQNIRSITRSWEDSIQAVALITPRVTDQQTLLACQFPNSYRDLFSAESAIKDAGHILNLNDKRPLCVTFYDTHNKEKQTISLRLFHRREALALSKRVPLLENMGFRVIAEQTLELPDGHGRYVYLHDMQLESAFKLSVDLDKNGLKHAETFEAIWAQNADNDAFNTLTQTAQLDWREIIILRHYGRYLQQTGIPYSQKRVAQSLNSYPDITQDLYALFHLKFHQSHTEKERESGEKIIQQRIEEKLQNVPGLDDDLILRRYRNLISASLRTNAFTPLPDGSPRRILATKLDPRQIEGLPEPRPYREIFVYGPEVEGVHLRFGPVARGGIRWSDRALDYRTEVLDLVKAQQVKNAVIVPVGAKGGFYPHRLPQTNDRAVVTEAARQAYIEYITALLSITDNLIDGKVSAPHNVIRYDGDDPYFVVAADKGTATFSDTANAISQAQNFWLDDAFASGGSAGYDHKAIGITAKGAWEAVKRHFRELFDHDIQETPFTCVGVGDMSGDVFGNGMLLSKKTKLIAAFDHRDIFIDPEPDITESYAERMRLFQLPRSSWQDYDKMKLSKGGGIFSRTTKTITLSPEAARAIGFEKQTGTPFEIVSAILKAPVDLLWFGGIGTYVRATTETDDQVGDRANDALRVTGKQVRAKVVGEGANLGLTQRGRIEYILNGGRCNTDAIDNSAGVNCSDLEVNIKIVLASALRAKTLTREARNELLKKMTPQVEQLVLRNNYLQTLSLSLAESRSVVDLPYQMRFMRDLEQKKLLDRKVEILPDEQILHQRIAQGQGLTRPELAVILAYAKLTLQEEIAHNPVVDDRYFDSVLLSYFPTQIQENFEKEVINHQLRRNIIATLIANDIANRGGPTFVNRLQNATGQKIENLIRVFIAVRDGFEISQISDQIDNLDNKIPGLVQNKFYAAITSMLFETTNWGLRNMDLSDPLKEIVKTIKEARIVIEKQLTHPSSEDIRQKIEEKTVYYSAEGAPKALAKQLALLEVAPMICDISLVAKQSGSDLIKTTKIYSSFAQMIRINRINEASQTIPVLDYYDDMALSRAREDIAESLRRIVIKILKNYGEKSDPLAAWSKIGKDQIHNVTNRIGALIEKDLNISRFTFAAGMIAQLKDVAF
ncbi:NAD glutamate dehydrogenase [Bartonella australis AUST/NH1]|uniref:NAD glutamate dehydrogenase n=1 Tax=Bartonella australis (strain Aust/NH1) TaxID=1094489 RepID=M1P0D7_BARAA|nr:NAD-glutamate dehydrogenase [Bartonella australis]AGF75107.1 NAD glutamate dehydrogenase [Bartonella australis AUST/NH1]